MPFNIEAFKATHGALNGYQRTNKFVVQVPTFIGASRLVEFMCQDAAIPGYQIMTGNMRRWSYGVNEMRPFAPNFVQAQLLFNIDGNHDVLNFFHDWMSIIVPHDVGSDYLISYKEDYVRPLRIVTFNEVEQVTRTVTLREAFPSNINQTALSWGDQNQIAQFTVFIEYVDWDVS